MTAPNENCYMNDHDWEGVYCKWCGVQNMAMLWVYQFEKAEREGRTHYDHFHRSIEAKTACRRQPESDK